MRSSGEPRTYGESCAVAHALDLIGERWALLVVRELMLGPKRFADLQASLPRVSANVLTQRLRDLERAGVLAQRTLPPPVSANVYELTPWGHELRDVTRALGRWGARSPSRPTDRPLTLDSHLLALHTMFAPSADVARRTLRVNVDIGGHEYGTIARRGALDVQRGHVPDATATISVDDGAHLLGAVFGVLDADELIDQGVITLTGAIDVARTWLESFRLPPVAASSDTERATSA